MAAWEKVQRWLIHLYQRRRAAVRQRWRRDLPFTELLFDRWERAKNLRFGEGSSIYHNSYVFGDVAVGKNTWIGPLTMLDGTGGLTIGDNCSISTGVQIYTHDSVKWAVSGGKCAYDYAPVQVGNCCYIGSGAIIRQGVTIGDHSVVGAMSFVNKDIPPYSVAFGVPCKIRGRVLLPIDNEVLLDMTSAAAG